MQLCLATHEFSSESAEDLKIRSVVDSQYPLVRPGTIRKETYSTIPFVFRNDAEWFAFERLRLLGTKLKFETCYGETHSDIQYLRFGQRQVTRLTSGMMSAGQIRLVEVSALEVAPL